MSEQSAHRSGGAGRILAGILAAVLGFFAGAALYVWLYLDVVDYRPIKKVDDLTFREGDGPDPGEVSEEGVYIDDDHPVERVAQKDPDIRNILIFGVDARNPEEEVSRTDSLMILTMNRRTHDVKLTSVLRDTEMPLATAKGTRTKINAAYVYGGIGLLINTLNRQLGLDIQEYMMFDFWNSSAIVDEVGGVEIEVADKEVDHLNQIIRSMNRLFGDPEDKDLVGGAGRQTLNGKQAISWARIRYIDSDFVRTQRQRTLVEAMMRKVSSLEPNERIHVGRKLLASVSTNLTKPAIMESGYIMMQGLDSVEQYRVPADGMYDTNMDNWNMIVDWDRQLPPLHAFIWED